MDEFALINTYFKSIKHQRKDIVLGIGDDAACLQVPNGMQLLVSSDTLVADVHFLTSWDAYDIAYRAVMVNVSDIAAMGGSPCWLTLALTLPQLDEHWVKRFSYGLSEALSQYNMALVGGDTTRGPLSLTLTIHGLVPSGCMVTRKRAAPGDIIYVSGLLGAAALAVASFSRQSMDKRDQATLFKALVHPKPRIDLGPHLRSYASAAIDISDGLSADLQHICSESRVGACVSLDRIPVHPLVQSYEGKNALDFALSGGDDYELCFTVSPAHEQEFLLSIERAGIRCYPIGVIEQALGLRARTSSDQAQIVPLEPRGYNHFC